MSNEKSRRSGHKAYVTKTIGEVDTLLTSFEKKDTARIKSFIETLQDQSKLIKDLDGKILDALTEDAEIGEEIMKSSEFHQKVRVRVVGLHEALDSLSESTKNEQADVKPGMVSGTDREYVKLPRIPVGKFNGDHLKFQEWWETYDAAVHSNPTVNDTMKFNYLRGYLEGTAASAIAGISLSGKNYTEAIELLKSRFGNKQALISAHVDKFLNLPDDVQSDDVEELREMYDIIEVNVRSLKSLNVLTDHLGPVLVQIVMKKLPDDIKLIVSRSMMQVTMATSTSSDSADEGSSGWKIENLISVVRQEIESREMCRMVSAQEKQVRNEDRPSKKDHYNNLNTGTKSKKIKCVFCNKKHASHLCETVTEVRSRLSILRRKGRCFICLRSGHISAKCEIKYKCAVCKERHNISICEKRVAKQSDNDENDSDLSDAGDSGTKKAEKADKTAACVAASNTTSITFLQTAKAVASNSETNTEANVRVLFDLAAQKSFREKRPRFVGFAYREKRSDDY